MIPQRLRRPEEGWLTLGPVLLMVLVLAWAVDDPAWVNGREAMTDGLALTAVLGALAGFAGPKLGWGRWTTHLVGAAFAGLLLPVFAGWAAAPGASPGEAFRLAASGSVEAYLDIAWRGRPFTQQEVHYVVVLGAVVWGTAQFAAHAVFGHRQPLAAVVVTGLVLLANMALTSRDQLPHLVVFAGASLVLLVGMHVVDERAAWLRRGIGDPGAVSGLYLRGGTLFIVIALVGSLGLTQRAASSPLAGAWEGVDEQLIRVGEELGRLFPVGGDLRGLGGVNFGSTARISSRWFSDDGIAFEATLPAGLEGMRWRAATYDRFALQAWEQTDVERIPLDPGASLLDGSAELDSPGLAAPVRVEVRPEDYRGGLLLAPGTPLRVDRGGTLLVTGTDRWFVGVDLPSSRGGYAVETAVLQLDEEGAISGNRLRAASEDYPAEVAERYTEIPEGALGPDARDLLATILERSPGSDPYDLAVTMQDFLRSDPRFTYNTDLRGVACDAGSAVECFARTRQGYCLQYASTMAILLRAARPDNPIPTRLVQGFLPGSRTGATEVVRNRNAHAWVEVFFPGYGWIPFDPTGGGVGRPSRIPAGPPVEATTPAPSAATGRDDPDPTRRLDGTLPEAGPRGPVAPDRGADRGILAVLAALLAALVLGAAVAAWLRGPRGEVSPDGAWRAMSRAASRFGFAPRPNQTVYEYAAALGELVPVARPDLQTVADAKVETAYARASLPPERLRAVREAVRGLRLSLLRLAIRAGRRRRSRRR